MKRTRAKLVWWLYAISVVQLVLLAASVIAVGAVLGPPDPPDRPHGPGPEGPNMHRGPPPPPHHRPGPIVPLVTFFGFGLVIVAAGAFMTARWIVNPLGELSRAARALGSGDLRARAGLERNDELGEVGKSFDEMAERVQRLLLREKELLADISHELRTPLARIRVALDLATEGDAVAAQRRLADITVDLAELEALIDNVLVATRLDMAQGDATVTPLDAKKTAPRDVVERAAERFRALHAARPLDVSIDDGLDDIDADPILFRRVIDNLLENAHKYTPDPTCPVKLGARAVASASGGGAGGGRAVLFTVTDRGVGIAEGDVKRVFTPFFRAEASRSRGTGGVGLGLTLAKRVVEAHGGTIDVTSAPGSGTTVDVRMPGARES